MFEEDRQKISSMPRKRNAFQSLENNDKQPTIRPKLSKKEAREQAMHRAKLTMQADKLKVEAFKERKRQQKVAGCSADEGGQEMKHRKVNYEEKKLSKKTAREEAIQRAKEWGAKEKKLKVKKRTKSSPKKPSAERKKAALPKMPELEINEGPIVVDNKVLQAAPSRKKVFCMRFLVSTLAVGVLSYLLIEDGGSLDSYKESQSPAIVDPPCFLCSVPVLYENEEVVSSCMKEDDIDILQAECASMVCSLIVLALTIKSQKAKMGIF